MSHKKLNFWGAVASIIGVPLAIFFWVLPPTTASSQSQPRSSVSTTGYQSPAIGSSGGDINIQYNSAPVKEKSYVLRNVKYGATGLVDSPDPAAMGDPKRLPCLAPAGTSVVLTGRKANMGQIEEYLREVKVSAGNCVVRSGG